MVALSRYYYIFTLITLFLSTLEYSKGQKKKNSLHIQLLSIKMWIYQKHLSVVKAWVGLTTAQIARAVRIYRNGCTRHRCHAIAVCFYT